MEYDTFSPVMLFSFDLFFAGRILTRTTTEQPFQCSVHQSLNENSSEYRLCVKQYRYYRQLVGSPLLFFIGIGK
jgi:hypothetical protein